MEEDPVMEEAPAVEDAALLERPPLPLLGVPVVLAAAPLEVPWVPPVELLLVRPLLHAARTVRMIGKGNRDMESSDGG